MSPIVLTSWDPATDQLLMKREGEPSMTGAPNIGDAIMAAFARGTELHIPRSLFQQLRDAGEMPPECPSWIQVV